MSVYGNCYPGEYPATFNGVSRTKFSKNRSRLIFEFLILTDDRTAPRQDNRGHDLYAVSVCNPSDGLNPKSKPYKIRRAMLEADEYDAIEAARSVPPWEHFVSKRQNGSRRIMMVRVARKGPEVKQVAVVTHLQRPREGVWECLDQEFEGPSRAIKTAAVKEQPPILSDTGEARLPPVKPTTYQPVMTEPASAEETSLPRPDTQLIPETAFELPKVPSKAAVERFSWLNADGTVAPPSRANEERFKRLSEEEYTMWSHWNFDPVRRKRRQWYDQHGNLRELTLD